MLVIPVDDCALKIFFHSATTSPSREHWTILRDSRRTGKGLFLKYSFLAFRRWRMIFTFSFALVDFMFLRIRTSFTLAHSGASQEMYSSACPLVCLKSPRRTFMTITCETPMFSAAWFKFLWKVISPFSRFVSLMNWWIWLVRLPFFFLSCCA